MTTLVLNRSLLHVRRVEVVEAFAMDWPHVDLSKTVSHSISPFGSPPENLENWELAEEIREEEKKHRRSLDTLTEGTPLVAEFKNFVSWEKKGSFDHALDSRTSVSCLVYNVH